MSQLKVPAYRENSSKARPNRKALSLITIFFITTLIILFLRSPISKISSIEVSGQALVPIEKVVKTSGLVYGASFFTWSSQTVIEKLSEIKEIESVAITTHFPGKIFIKVKEYPLVAFQMSDNKLQPVLANGLLIAPDNSKPMLLNRPILTGWEQANGNKALLCKELSLVSEATLSTLSEIRPKPSEAYPDKIVIFTRDGYEIETTVNQLSKNLETYRSYVSENGDKVKGTLYLLDAKYFRPYSTPGDIYPHADSSSEKDTTQ